MILSDHPFQPRTRDQFCNDCGMMKHAKQHRGMGEKRSVIVMGCYPHKLTFDRARFPEMYR